MSKRMYHPCHKLSVPSAKLFWCRHCMQMFEDAISRWKHSKFCKGSRKVTDDKDLNGQVIQLYVKPDKVSYQENNIPGQGLVKYKPHIKKKSAELKCLICQRRFLSLDNIREHVKYPCRRAYHKSGDTFDGEETEPGLDEIKDPTLIRIRRAEFTTSTEIEVSTPGSGLSVLAEASKHIESLIPGNNSVEKPINLFGETVQTSHTGVNTQLFQKKTSIKPVDPLLIVFQQEDGSLLPVEQLDPDIVTSTLQDTAASLPVGQVLQVQLGADRVQNYVKTLRGDIVAVQTVTTEAEIQKNSSAFTTTREVKEASVNTPYHCDILEASGLPPFHHTPLNRPSTSVVAKPQALSTVPTLLGLLHNTQNSVKTEPLPIAVVDTGAHPYQTNSSDLEVRQRPVLEETVEEQGFLLPAEEQSYL